MMFSTARYYETVNVVWINRQSIRICAYTQTLHNSNVQFDQPSMAIKPRFQMIKMKGRITALILFEFVIEKLDKLQNNLKHKHTHEKIPKHPSHSLVTHWLSDHFHCVDFFWMMNTHQFFHFHPTNKAIYSDVKCI